MKRPIGPETLRKELEDAKGKGNTINPPSVWAVVSWFRNRGIEDAERHAIMKWLTGDQSTKSLCMAQVGILAEFLTGVDSEQWVTWEIAMLREAIEKDHA